MNTPRTLTALTALALTCFAALAGCDQDQARDPGFASPRSLEGTEVDGRFGFDREGGFAFDEQAQLSFDYFLTADGELTPAELDAWVSDVVRSEVGSGEAHAQIMDSWRDYLLYRAEAAAALDDPQSAEQAAAVEQRLLAAIDTHLGDAPLAASERARIRQGFALQRAYGIGDRDQRELELARLAADEQQQFAQTRAGRYLAGRQAVEQARQTGADAQEIQQLRAQHFDAIEPGAGERLAALDARREAWNQRLEAFHGEREQLRADFVGAPAQLDAAIDELEARHFSAAERRRVHALDRL